MAKKKEKKEEGVAYSKIIEFLFGSFLFWICRWGEVFLGSPKQKIPANRTSLWWFQSNISILPVHWTGICHFTHPSHLAAVIWERGRACIFSSFNSALLQLFSLLFFFFVCLLLSRQASSTKKSVNTWNHEDFLKLNLQAMHFFKNSSPEFQRSI